MGSWGALLTGGLAMVGAGNDRQVQAVLGLLADHEPRYLIPVGHARE